MANLVSRSSGNLTAAGTWKTVETGTRAIQSAHSATTNTTTSDVYNADAQDLTIANLSVIEGILLFCNRVNTTGTVTVTLSADSGTTATRTVTVNASDLPASPSWVFFKFGTTLTGDGGTDYAIAIKGSSTGNATFYRDGTTANWTHFVVTDQNPGSVAAGDVFFVVGELTGAGTGNDFTVTMDSTATTDYGTGTDGADVNGMEIGKRGVVTYGTTAATNYYLKLSGSLNVWGDGTLNIGTTGTPIPRDSTAVLEFDPVADGGMGLLAQNGSTVNIQGLSRTSSKNIIACKLNTDEAVASTSLGVDTDTGWLDNDEIVVVSTTRTATETEKGTLNGNAGASSLTVDGFGGAGGGLANAHSGTSPTQAEVILLTRNVRVRSATSTIMTYFYIANTAVIDIDWAEFYYMGENASTKRGFEVTTTTGSLNVQYSSLHDFEDWGVNMTGSSSLANITFSNNCFYNLNTSQVSGLYSFGTSNTLTSTNIVVSGNYFIGCFSGASIGIVHWGDVGQTFTNNVIAGCTLGTNSYGALTLAEGLGLGTFSGNVVHSNNGVGLLITTLTNGFSGTFTNFTIWRNNSSGISGATSSSTSKKILFDGLTIFGNATQNISISNLTPSQLVFKSMASNSDATFSTATGLTISVSTKVYLIDCTFSNLTAHTQDIAFPNSLIVEVFAWNTTLAASTEVSGLTSSNLYSSFFRSHKHDASGTTFKAVYRQGTIQNDTSVRHTASGYSWKMTPSLSTDKLVLPGPLEYDTMKAVVNASSAVTITVYVRKDSSYNGNAPRLVLVGGIIGGIASDVTDSLSVGADTWEQLSVSGTPNEQGVVEFYVDCDGTAGNVYVDDVTVTQA